MFKNVCKSLGYNLKTLLKFEFIYKLLTIFLFSPLFSFTFKTIMRATGYKYLSFENILSFISKPVTIFMIIILLIIMTLYTLFEISTIIIITNASMQNIKVTLREALIVSFSMLKKLIRRSRLGLVFIVLFLIPFLNIGIATSFISIIRIPEFILDYIKSNTLYFTMYVLLMAFFLFLLLRWIYTINYMVIDDLGFYKSRRESVKLSHGNHLKDLVKILVTEALIYVAFIIFVFAGILLIYLINKYLSIASLVNSLLITIIWLFLSLSLVIFSLMSVPMSYAAITCLFYNHKITSGENCSNISFEEVKNYHELQNKNKYNKFYKIKFAIFLLVIISGTVFTHGVIKGKYDLNISHIYSVDITAHRGSSNMYPENTMLAFKNARKEGANWIELDVQMSKDGYLIVAHDSNLRRTAGVNSNIWELTYEELQDIDVGNDKYKNLKMPLLDEVIDWAVSHNIKLNIELKPTGHEKDLEKKVVELITENGYKNNCIISSANYSSLKKVKSFDKKITTIYIMSLAYGDILSIDDVDGYSIEANNISKSLVKKVHKDGKLIHVWTVNNENSITNMIKYGVDNIITDDVTFVKNVVEKNQESNMIFDYINLIRRIFG